MKRLTSLDFWRGIAIFCTTIFHFLFTSWDLFQGSGAGILSSGSIPLIILAGVIFVFIHWRGFFLMISSVVNHYQMESAAKKGKNLFSIFGKQLLTGFILVIVGKLWVTVFPYWGFIERWSRAEPVGVTLAESWMNSWDMFFLIEAIESIGLMMIVTAFFFLFFKFLEWLPLKIKGTKIKLGNWVVKTTICYLIGIVILWFSPAVGEWAKGVAGVDITMGEGFRAFGTGYFHTEFANLGDFFANFGAVMKRVALNWIAGREAPLFPMMASYFFGMGICYIMTQEGTPRRSHVRWMLIPALLAVLWGVYEFLFIEGGGFLFGASLDLGFHIHPRWFAFVSFGLQSAVILMMVSFTELNYKLREKSWIRGTRFIRRFGIFSLTVYFLGIMDFILRFIFQKAFYGSVWIDATETTEGMNFISRYGLNTQWTMILVGIIMVLWTFGLWVWDRVGRGYGSFEFLLSLLKIPQAGRKRNWGDPINLKGSLREIEAIVYLKDSPEERARDIRSGKIMSWIGIGVTVIITIALVVLSLLGVIASTNTMKIIFISVGAYLLIGAIFQVWFTLKIDKNPALYGLLMIILGLLFLRMTNFFAGINIRRGRVIKGRSLEDPMEAVAQ
jgi:hypothetical protein